jgi:hypothetical protein
MNALYDVAPPVAGNFIYLMLRAWRAVRRQAIVLPSSAPDEGGPHEEMPVVGASKTSGTPPI